MDPRRSWDDARKALLRGEQGGADAPAQAKRLCIDFCPWAWTRLRPRSTRLTLPATLTDVQPARLRDRVGAIPQLRVHSASAHSGGGHLPGPIPEMPRPLGNPQFGNARNNRNRTNDRREGMSPRVKKPTVLLGAATGGTHHFNFALSQPWFYNIPGTAPPL